MITEKINKLTNTCDSIINTIPKTTDWVGKYKIVPQENKKALNYQLNKYRRDTQRYKDALTKRPSIAIFGQSQVGKSYLVSNLAKRNEDFSLMVEVPGENKKIDFIEEMNPPGGGKEATGLVSRFTVQDNYSSGQKPYLLKLFSQCDIVKIITNGYLSDIKPYVYEVNKVEVQNIINLVKAKKSSSIQAGFTEDDVFELKEYLNHNFRSHSIIKDFNNLNFWDDIADIIPYLSYNIRYEILELLWGKQDFFTELFKNCSSGLKEIDFAKEVRCGLQALSPNTDTLLDVQRLREMFGDGTVKQDVDLYRDTTKIARLPRSVVSAITAEVILPLPKDIVNTAERAFLKDADILDFPGARSRNMIPEQTFIENDNVDKLEIFLRGKVAFLFDRYNYNFEISTLMFCMHNDQPEVQDIPRLLYEWISTNHGASPQERETRENLLSQIVPNSGIKRIIPLLVVQTKFNIDLKGNPATETIGKSASHDWKWNARLDANFHKFMIKPVVDKWPESWNISDGSFKNIFLLRDPKWSTDVFEGYDSTNKNETGLKSPYDKKLEDMKTSFLSHKYTNLHFRSPMDAWVESCTPNKSGIDYIVKYLSPTCNPIIRLERLKTLIHEQKTNVLQAFENYVDSGDLASKLKKAKVNGAKVFMSMMKWVKKTNGFGAFLDELTINEDEAWKVYWNLKSSPPKTENNGQDANNEQSVATFKQYLEEAGIPFDISKDIRWHIEQLKEFFGFDDDESIYEVLKEADIDLEKILKGGESVDYIKSEAEIYSEMLIENWFSKVINLKNNTNLLNKGLSKNIISLVCNTLDKSKERIGLKRLLTDRIHDEVEYFSVSKNYNIVAHISATTINDYINSIGWKFVDETITEYPKVKNVPVYSKQGVLTPKKEDLRMDIDYPGMLLFNEWNAGIRNSFTANVLFEEKAGNTEDALVKQKLNDILKKM